MSYNARLVAITEVANVPPNLIAFVHFKAAMEKRVLKQNEKVAILQIEGTESYFPIFLDGKPSLKKLETDLEKQETKLDSSSKEVLARHMND